MVDARLADLLLQNRTCADCLQEPVTHVSVQNGISLCTLCAEKHSRNLLREHTSFVRAVTMMPWRED